MSTSRPLPTQKTRAQVYEELTMSFSEAFDRYREAWSRSWFDLMTGICDDREPQLLSATREDRVMAEWLAGLPRDQRSGKPPSAVLTDDIHLTG